MDAMILGRKQQRHRVHADRELGVDPGIKRRPALGMGMGSHPHMRGRWPVSTDTVVAIFLAVLLVMQLVHRKPPDPGIRENEGHIRAVPTRAFCAKMRPPMVCAHGGDSSTAPPNTAAAFQAAIDGGADCIEIDAARTRDGVLVVLHVRELQQLLGGQRAGVQVGDLDWADISALRWKPGKESVLTVEQAVGMTSPYVDFVTLDVKTYQNALGQEMDEDQIAEQLVRLVHTTRCTNCLIWAKSDRVVRSVKQMSPGQRAGYIVMNETQDARQAGMHEPLRMAEPEVVGIHFAMVDAKMLRLLHAGGKEMHAWTINSAALMHHVLDVGVDALVTNFPRMAKDAIDARVAQCGDVMASGRSTDYSGSL